MNHILPAKGFYLKILVNDDLLGLLKDEKGGKLNATLNIYDGERAPHDIEEKLKHFMKNIDSFREIQVEG